MKLTGLIIIVLSTSAAGWAMYDNSKKRIAVCRELIVLCGCLKRDFLYRSTPINTLIFDTIESLNLSHLNFITEAVITDSENIRSPLSSAANKELSNFFHSLGRSDTETQINLVDGFCDYITKEEEIQKNNHSKNSRLYLSFGVFSGVLVALFFV